MTRPQQPHPLAPLSGWHIVPDSRVTQAVTALARDALTSPLDYGQVLGRTIDGARYLARVEDHYDDHAGGGLRWHRGVTVYEAVPDTLPAPPMHPAHVSAAGRAFIAREERVVLRVYADPIGKPTCGVGHLLRPGDGVHPAPVGTPITAETCDRLLAADLAMVENEIHRCVRVELGRNQFDALASWAFNVGAGALASSTLARTLNAGAYGAVPAQLLAWCRAGGRELPGLLARRRREGELWSTPDPVDDDADAVAAIADLARVDALSRLELHEGFGDGGGEPSA